MIGMQSDVVSDTLSAITRRVREERPGARGLILAGSAARGEAAIAARPDGIVWLSDIDMLVLVDDRAVLSDERKTLNALALRISEDAKKRGIDVAVELKPAPRKYFENIKPSLFAYELAVCGRQLYGDYDALSLIQRFDWRLIPLEDGWRLLSNRMIEWLGYLANPGRLPLAAQMQILTKQYLDLLTSLTLFSGHYRPKYAARVEALPEVLDWLSGTSEVRQTDLIEAGVRLSWRFRRSPDTFEYVWRSGEQDLPAALRNAGQPDLVHGLAGLLSSMWRAEAGWACGRTLEGAAVPSAMTEIYGFRGLARGWAKACLSTGGPSWRMLALAWKGTPRVLVYDCAASLLHAVKSEDRRALSQVRRRLPVVLGECRTDWSDLARQCVKIWDVLLRHSAA